MQNDQNFDGLAERFLARVYGTHKGNWRLTLLQEDLQHLRNGHQLDVWDAGCGDGRIAAWFAEKDHQLTLCDISSVLLDKARLRFAEKQLTADFHQQPAQTLAETLPDFDLIISHAVLEWLATPQQSLLKLLPKVRPGGWLSLMFFNRNALVYSNALRGGWRLEPILNDSYIGVGRKLTPPNPQYPHEIVDLLEQQGFHVETQTGIRVFADYLSDEARERSDDQTLFSLEARYCRQPGYRDMGRYIHLLARRGI